MLETGPRKQAMPHWQDAGSTQHHVPSSLWKNLSPHNLFLVPLRLGTSVLMGCDFRLPIVGENTTWDIIFAPYWFDEAVEFSKVIFFLSFGLHRNYSIF